jgi:hypothetical protein
MEQINSIPVKLNSNVVTVVEHRPVETLSSLGRPGRDEPDEFGLGERVRPPRLEVAHVIRSLVPGNPGKLRILLSVS